MEAKTTYKSFEELEVYVAARQFRKSMYRVAGKLPEIEKFGLMNQIRRAAVSLTNNIAEGHGRFHYLDQIRFLLQARGSLQELIDDLNICLDEEYFALPELEPVRKQAFEVGRLLGGYIRYLRTCKSGQGIMRETEVDYKTPSDLSLETL